jgi:hypothetical protein
MQQHVIWTTSVLGLLLLLLPGTKVPEEGLSQRYRPDAGQVPVFNGDLLLLSFAFWTHPFVFI